MNSTRVKKHPRKGTKGVRSHTRFHTPTGLSSVPHTSQDREYIREKERIGKLIELRQLQDDLKEYKHHAKETMDDDEREMLEEMVKEWSGKISKFPKTMQREASELYK